MPRVSVNGIRLHYEEAGQGAPLVFVHEFAGRPRAGISRCASSPAATGRSPSTPAATPVRRADRRERLLAGSRRRGHPRAPRRARDRQGPRLWAVDGGYATLHFGLRHPSRARSLVVAGCGYGSVAADRAQFQRDVAATAERFLTEPMATLADVYCRGAHAGAVPRQGSEGWQEFHDLFAAQSALGHGLTMRGVQLTRP